MILTSLLGGCATSATSTSSYSESNGKNIENEILIKKDFEEVWSTLVKQLAKSFFVVNNIEKESRLINVSFSTETPEKYINCGRTTRTFKLGDEVLTTSYDVAADSSYKFGHGTTANRQFSLVAYI